MKRKTTNSRPWDEDEELRSLIEQLRIELTGMSDRKARDAWGDAIQTAARTGDLALLIEQCAYARPIVPVDTFLFDPAYLGVEENKVYPKIIEACHELDKGIYTEAVLKGALGIGKSTLANLMLSRDLYKLSCMRNPQNTFGLPSKSSIIFTIQSIRLSTAKKAVFNELGQYLRKSPYFEKIYPYDKKVLSEMIFRRNNVSVVPVSSATTGAISMNVMGGILDEMNFMQKIGESKSSEASADGSFDQAKALYDTLAKRRKSRFMQKGKLPGTLYLISSSRFPDDFTEVKAAQSTMCGGTDPSIYVYSYAQWDVKPKGTFSDQTFRVLIGNDTIRSKVLAPGETALTGCEVIEVPEDFRVDFENSTDGAIRDFAGKTTLATSPFILKRECIAECMEAAEKAGYRNIFRQESVDLSLGMPRPVAEYVRLDVDSPRACHVDLGLKKDACGIAVGHVAGLRMVESYDPVTEKRGQEWMPVIAIDFALRVVAPPGGEIEFASIRALLIALRDDYGLPLKWITFDGFQSVDSRQILKTKGFSTEYISVEKIEPYNVLRDALYESRLLLPRHIIARTELSELEQVVKNNKIKVDHRPQSSKDVADALCGVTNFLMTRKSSWAMAKDYSFDARTRLLGDAATAESIRTGTCERTVASYLCRAATKRRAVLRRLVKRR
jgi:hypothetical protein